MRKRHYFVFVIAVIVGIIFANGLVQGVNWTYKYIKSKTYTSLDHKYDKGAPVRFNLVEDFPGEQNPELDPDNPGGEVAKRGKVLLVDLEQMRLTAMEDNEIIEVYEIISKGVEGTPWETPPGQYKVLYKTEDYFSPIAGVWMPYSMQFFGNFYIHGDPYYTGGRVVSGQFDGGAIRLITEDAKELYQFADSDTDVLVRGSYVIDKDTKETGRYEKFDEDKNFPSLSAASYMIGDLDTGEVIAFRDKDKQRAIASITKLMTALVSLDTLSQSEEAFISYKAVSTYGDQGGLRSGSRIVVGDLLYPLLLESSNDAAEVIAEFAGRNFFIDNLNTKAQSIGLRNTEFDDPSGLSAGNKSTAEDLFKMARYIHQHKNYIFDISRLKSHRIEGHYWTNFSDFRDDSNYRGGKNGYIDEAGHTLIATFSLPLEEFGRRRVTVILLNSRDNLEDVNRVLLYLLNNVYYDSD